MAGLRQLAGLPALFAGGANFSGFTGQGGSRLTGSRKGSAHLAQLPDICQVQGLLNTECQQLYWHWPVYWHCSANINCASVFAL